MAGVASGYIGSVQGVSVGRSRARQVQCGRCGPWVHWECAGCKRGSFTCKTGAMWPVWPVGTLGVCRV